MRKFLTVIALLMMGGILGYIGPHAVRGFSDGFSNGLTDGPNALDVSAPVDGVAIRDMLITQSAAWNTGDIDAFMSDYWQSDDLRFASGGNITYGWQGTLEGYKTRYPDKAAMGTLAFTDLDIKMLSRDDALAFGRWTLTRETDAPTGLFTLHVKKVHDEWKIVSDHTSSAD